MNDPIDRDLAAFVLDGPARGPEEPLERALTTIRRAPQRPAWAVLEWWVSGALVAPSGWGVRRMGWFLVALAVVAALVGALVFAGSQRHLPAPFGLAKAGLIAFDSKGDIFVANGDGTGRRQLTSGSPIDTNPTWSPDGTRLAYWSQPDDSNPPASLIVVDSNGTNPQIVAEGVAIVPGEAIGWAPDSRTIVYSGGSAPRQIFATSLDRPTPIGVGDPSRISEDPAWSPDGTTIAFHSTEDNGVYLMNADGSNIHRITTPEAGSTPFSFARPEWSPDGRRILFFAGHSIWVVHVDGTSQRALTRGAADTFWATWSPDGNRIAFERGPYLMMMNADGSDVQHLAVGEVTPAPPIWAPDGTRLYCHSIAANEIYVVDVAGKAAPIVIPAEGDLGNGNWQRLAP